MSKLNIRIIVSVLISLILLVAIYTSVLGAPNERTGTHLVSGARVNLDHYRLAAPDQSSASFSASDSLSTQKEGGHGCGADQASSPDD